jgi:hypothetical protein
MLNQDPSAGATKGTSVFGDMGGSLMALIADPSTRTWWTSVLPIGSFLLLHGGESSLRYGMVLYTPHFANTHSNRGVDADDSTSNLHYSVLRSPQAIMGCRSVA